ncbi:sulfhydryl oxidase 1 [Phtheirospermum japonicum]|uniref:Sulfhydryl oxidase n=1 Tax=Phtheirospermum japonicum TaxID=374723 RepID=A0A830D499_9LAMI|nr:sulfhydryl oxidase 1 [Phtheirospermum japonicum]
MEKPSGPPMTSARSYWHKTGRKGPTFFLNLVNTEVDGILPINITGLVGCILLSVGQVEFHSETLHTLNYVVNQSEYTVQTLRNVTEYLSMAKSVSVAQIFLPSDVMNDIDKLNVDLNNAADMLEQKTSENSSKIRKAICVDHCCSGYAFHINSGSGSCRFIVSGWLLIAVTLILCGVFVILDNTISDTCMAMGEWVENPHAETALGNILPCVDQRTTNQTLFKSKLVINDIANMVNGFVGSVANSNPPPQANPAYYNQSGPVIPPLCYPYDSQLRDRSCSAQELSMGNASLVWQNYTCATSANGLCITVGRLTPNMYKQLVDAVNVSYALEHYTPPLLNLQNCNFVRDTFRNITSSYCPPLEHYLRIVNMGLAMISVGVMLSLALWIFYANRPQREEPNLKRGEASFQGPSSPRVPKFQLGTFSLSASQNGDRQQIKRHHRAPPLTKPLRDLYLHIFVSIHICTNSMYTVMVITLLILTVFFSSNEVLSSPAIGSRSILRSIDDKAEKPDYAVELNATNFDSVLKDTPAAYAIVEFFAHWCPACRNYKPQYEKVAKIFNGADAAHPGILLMTRVDCASKINTNLCEKFSVSHYPMLLWAPPSKFVSASWDPKQEKSEIRALDDWRTADRLLNWINKQLSSSYNLDDEKFENDQLQKNASDIGQIARAIYDIEEATSTAFDIILGHKMIKPETQASLIKFFQLLVVHHPSRRCRKGTAEILVDFDDVYAKNKAIASGGEKGALSNYQICGKDVPRGYWDPSDHLIGLCLPSKPPYSAYSYTCGLWVLLHSLSVRVDDGESQIAFTTICDFIHNFFICEECRQHFYSMCSSVTTPFKKSRDFALWLWDAHNKVNERLIKDEASLGTGDPQFPKTIWPPRQLCPSCHLNRKAKNPIEWDRDGVHKFLIEYYGNTLVTLYKDKELPAEKRVDSVLAEDLASSVSAHALVVPVGAALAIAVASCAFGALACYWRQQQKSRKYKHHLHPLKNI